MIKAPFQALLIGFALIQACSASSLPGPTIDVTGKWQGISRTTVCGLPLVDRGRCNAVNEITLTLFQEASNVTGVYTCATGNMICRNLNKGGRISASPVSGSLARLRVMMPDGSSCMFNGNFQAESAVGGFACHQGGANLEQGAWQVKRMF